MKNPLKQQTAFKFLEETFPKGISVSPLNGKLGNEENKEITIKYKFQSVLNKSYEISLMLRNGKIVKIPIQVKCTLPKVDISCKTFDFGKIAVDTESEIINFTLTNNQGEDLEFILDLKSNENPHAKFVKLIFD